MPPGSLNLRLWFPKGDMNEKAWFENASWRHTDLRPPCRVSDSRAWTLSSRGKSFCSSGTWGVAALTSGAMCAQTSPRAPIGGAQLRRRTRRHPPKTRRRRQRRRSPGAGRFVAHRVSALPINVHRGPLWPFGGALAAECHMAGFQRALQLLAWEDPEKERGGKETELGRRPHDPSYQLNSMLTWMSRLSMPWQATGTRESGANKPSKRKKHHTPKQEDSVESVQK